MSFEQYLGQRKLVTYLERLVLGAKVKGNAFPNSLILGPAGIGKTMLARCLARSYGTNLHVFVGGPQLSDVAFAIAGRAFNPNDLLFIDEAHSLSRKIQEVLFQVIDSQIIPTTDKTSEERRPRITGSKKVGPLTVLLATNQPGELLGALMSRMGLHISLERLSIDDMIQIGRQCASRLGILLTAQAMRLLATFSEGIPRDLEQRLNLLAMYHAQETKGNELNVDHVRHLLDAQGIDHAGLSVIERRYLDLLKNCPAEGTYLRTLTVAIGLDERYITKRIEQRFITKGWIVINGFGRVLTDLGRKLLDEHL